MPKEKLKVELPPKRHFTLSHILTHTPTVTEDLHNLNDSINSTNTLYTNDISDQLTSLAKVEGELLDKLQHVNDMYEVVHDIRVQDIGDSRVVENPNSNNNNHNSKSETVIIIDPKHRGKNKGIGIGLSASMFKISSHKNGNNKLQQYSKINDNFSELLDESFVQKKRIDGLLLRLKKIEMNLSKRERLFDDKSPNKTHYVNLYNYGMKENDKGLIRSETKNSDGNELKSITPSQYEPEHETSDKSPRKSFSSAKSKISQQKLNQYLDLENELEELKKTQSNACDAPIESIEQQKREFNPVTLIAEKIPVCKISDESITVRSNINYTKIDENNVHSENTNSLVNELKKLYT